MMDSNKNAEKNAIVVRMDPAPKNDHEAATETIKHEK